MIVNCPVTMECRLVQPVDLPTNSFFIAEIMNIYTEERFLTDGKPDVKKMNPFVLTMPDNRYWAIGDCIAKTWHEGIAVRDRLKGDNKNEIN